MESERYHLLHKLKQLLEGKLFANNKHENLNQEMTFRLCNCFQKFHFFLKCSCLQVFPNQNGFNLWIRSCCNYFIKTKMELFSHNILYEIPSLRIEKIKATHFDFWRVFHLAPPSKQLWDCDTHSYQQNFTQTKPEMLNREPAL